MKMKPMILMLVAVACGLVAMVGVQQVLGNRSGDTSGPKVKVLVARKEVQAGTPLDESCVGFREVSKSEVPEDVISTKEDFQQRAPRVKLFQGQYVLKKQLGEKGEYGASMEIPPGMRVVTVPVTATMTHSGLMSPGDRVDVQVTYSYSRPKVGRIHRTRTVLQYIQVWATDSVRMGTEAAKDDSSQSKNVSLLVYPGQGALLQLAKQKGELHLLLRGRNDKAPSDQTGDFDEDALDRKMADLFDDIDTEPVAATSPQAVAQSLPDSPAPKVEKPSFSEFLNAMDTQLPPAPPAPKPVWKVEIYTGDKKEVAEFEIPEATAKPAEADAAKKPAVKPAINPLTGWLGSWGSGNTRSTSSTKPAVNSPTTSKPTEEASFLQESPTGTPSAAKETSHSQAI